MPVRIISGESIDADLWNNLFSELDRKLTVVMDDKTWILCGDPIALGFMGMPFHFGNGRRPQSSWIPGPLYDHTQFTSVADSPEDDELELVDAGKKIVAIPPVSPELKAEIGLPANQLFLDRSLEAHRRLFAPDDDTAPAPHWILERPSPGLNLRDTPQKIHRFALAEIILEGSGLENFRFEERWNKYNCFRFHNCNGYAIQVDFAGQYKLTVPRYSCRTLRRIPLGDARPPRLYTWAPGFNYFLRFREGDPRLYQMPHDPATPAGTQGANNIVSPALVINRVVAAFSSRHGLGGTSELGGPKWLRDPYALDDVTALHRTYFPAGSR